MLINLLNDLLLDFLLVAHREEFVEVLPIEILPSFHGELLLEEVATDSVVELTVHIGHKVVDDVFKDDFVKSHLLLKVIDVEIVEIARTSGDFELHEEQYGANIDKEEASKFDIRIGLIDVRLLLSLHDSVEDFCLFRVFTAAVDATNEDQGIDVDPVEVRIKLVLRLKFSGMCLLHFFEVLVNSRSTVTHLLKKVLLRFSATLV